MGLAWSKPVKSVAPPFRGDSGIRRAITQGETQDARSLIMVGAVAAHLGANGYQLLPYQRQGCETIRAVAFVSAFQQLTCVLQPHPFVRRVLAFGVGDIDDAWAETRFLRQDFTILMAALRIPETLQMENRDQCRGEEALLVLLLRLSDSTRLLDLMPTVGREYSQIYRMEARMREYLHDTWRHLLLDNWDFMAARLPLFNEHFVAKYCTVNNLNLAAVPPYHRGIALAMDGHKRPVPRPQVCTVRTARCISDSRYHHIFLYNNPGQSPSLQRLIYTRYKCFGHALHSVLSVEPTA